MKVYRLISLSLICILCGISISFAQNCPENIGFEKSSFNKWQTYIGSVSSINKKNVVTVSSSLPIVGRHSIISSKTQKDPYGGFPVLAPNNSGYSVKLGNDGSGSQAEKISYLISIPIDKPTFNLTYQYAVVFQDPDHDAYDQPRFTAKVLDLSTNTYITCASFEYIATSNLPGFKNSTATKGVIYKGWTPVSINLSGYQGKQVLLEFTTADCTLSGHFGYAYVDVNENCENIIQGNTYCENSKDITLKGPSGYEFYKWYNADKSIKYGEGESLTIKPPLMPGEKIVLDLFPFDGFGCPNSVSTVIVKGTFSLDVIEKINACKNDIVDLTSSDYILNKSLDVSYEVFSDINLTNSIDDPTQIKTSGIYYVKAKSINGCSDVKPIEIIFHEIVGVEVVSEAKSCADGSVDLTSNNVQKAIPAGLTTTYFTDLALTIPVADPKKITKSGDYYIKYQSQYCFIAKKIAVVIYDLPKLNVLNTKPVCAPQTVNLTDPAITFGSDPGLILSYYKDSNLNTPVENPSAITTQGIYFIKAVTVNGCVSIKPVFVEIYPLPVLVIRNPDPVCSPNTIDISNPELYNGSTANVDYTFFDASNGKKIANPKQISKTGIYWVNIKNANGCELTKEIKVEIYAQPKLVINQPKKVFISQAVDLTKPAIIEGSSGYIKVGYWNDDQMQNIIANPKAVSQTGVYYISLTNESGCTTIGSVSVIVVPWPKIIVPTAFTPFKTTNSKLYPFVEGLEKLVSFKVYNKWGNLVFETASEDPIKGWNGTYNGAAQPFETYSWYAEGINLLGQTFTNKGKTVLIP